MVESANPPAWAQTLLAIMVAPSDHDGIAGDLLEEFRDTRVPALGLARARRWYSAQVAGYVWRASRMWIGMLAILFVIADLHNQFRRPDGSVYFDMGALRLVAPGLVLAAGFTAGRRTRSIVAGLITAGVIQSVLLAIMAIWWNVTFYPFGLIEQHNPYWIAAWHYSGEGESFATWAFFDNIGAVIMGTLVLLPGAMLLGSAGAFAGKMSRGRT